MGTTSALSDRLKIANYGAAEPARRDRVRGVDRNSDDRSPTNQTKKAKRRAFQEKKAEAASRGEALKKK